MTGTTPDSPGPNGQAPESELVPGALIAEKYLLGNLIATGGMGEIYSARHTTLDTAVAIKFVRADLLGSERAVSRFINEAQAAASLSSEHVARVMDAGKLPSGVPYIVMEYLEGEDLGAILSREGRLGVPLAVDYVLQACEGLATAHASGIVHRDLKPENLLVTTTKDGKQRVKLLDFGIAKRLTAEHKRLTNPEHSLGSPCYMSPEQMKRPDNIDVRTDIWSMGCILYEALAGQRPFDGNTMPEICAKVLVEEPIFLGELRPDLPEQLTQAVHRCLQRDLDIRYPSITDFAADIEAYAEAAPQRSGRRSTSAINNSAINNSAIHHDEPDEVPAPERSTAPRAKPTPRDLRAKAIRWWPLAIGFGALLLSAGWLSRTSLQSWAEGRVIPGRLSEDGATTQNPTGELIGFEAPVYGLPPQSSSDASTTVATDEPGTDPEPAAGPRRSDDRQKPAAAEPAKTKAATPKAAKPKATEVELTPEEIARRKRAYQEYLRSQGLRPLDKVLKEQESPDQPEHPQPELQP